MGLNCTLFQWTGISGREHKCNQVIWMENGVMQSNSHTVYFWMVKFSCSDSFSFAGYYTRFDFVSLHQEVVKNRIESMTMLTNSNQFQHMLVEIFLLFWFENNSLYERGNKTKYQTYYNHKMMLSSMWKTHHFHVPPCTGRSWFWFCSETRNLVWTFFHSWKEWCL